MKFGYANYREPVLEDFYIQGNDKQFCLKKMLSGKSSTTSWLHTFHPSVGLECTNSVPEVSKAATYHNKTT